MTQIFGHGARVKHFVAVENDSLFIHGEVLQLLDFLFELGECGNVSDFHREVLLLLGHVDVNLVRGLLLLRRR